MNDKKVISQFKNKFGAPQYRGIREYLTTCGIQLNPMTIEVPVPKRAQSEALRMKQGVMNDETYRFFTIKYNLEHSPSASKNELDSVELHKGNHLLKNKNEESVSDSAFTSWWNAYAYVREHEFVSEKVDILEPKSPGCAISFGMSTNETQPSNMVPLDSVKEMLIKMAQMLIEERRKRIYYQKLVLEDELENLTKIGISVKGIGARDGEIEYIDLFSLLSSKCTESVIPSAHRKVTRRIDEVNKSCNVEYQKLLEKKEQLELESKAPDLTDLSLSELQQLVADLSK